MVYLNSTDRRAGAPLATPRQVDEARAAASDALAEARHPETGIPLFPQVIATAEAYGIDPAAEGFPDLIALPDEPYWVRTKLAPGRDLGRGRPEPARHASPRGDRRPLPAPGSPRAGPSRPTSTTSPRRSCPSSACPSPRTSRAGPSPAWTRPRATRIDPPSAAVAGPHRRAVRVHPRRAGPHRAEAGRPGLPGINRGTTRSPDPSRRRLRPDQIRSSRRRGLRARLHAGQTPVMMKRWPTGRKPCSRLTASRSRRTSSLLNSTIVLHSVQCRWSCEG